MANSFGGRRVVRSNRPAKKSSSKPAAKPQPKPQVNNGYNSGEQIEFEKPQTQQAPKKREAFMDMSQEQLARIRSRVKGESYDDSMKWIKAYTWNNMTAKEKQAEIDRIGDEYKAKAQQNINESRSNVMPQRQDSLSDALKKKSEQYKIKR